MALLKTKFLTLKQLLPATRKFETYKLEKETYAEGTHGGFLPTSFSNTRVGIEVEAENLPLNSSIVTSIFGELKWWELTTDPSLRNAGAELRSRGPLENEKAVAKALYELDLAMRAYKQADFSFRTGTHVHLCLVQFSLPQILTLFLAYNFVEPYLFEAFCPQRRFSNFCVPIGEGDRALSKHFQSMIKEYKEHNQNYDWISLLLKLWWANGHGTSVNYHNKYSAINLSRLRVIGTVEFRHLPGTGNFLFLRDWISTITSLADFCFKMDFEKFSDKLLSTSTVDKARFLLNKIIPKEIQKPIHDSFVLAGLEQAKTFLLHDRQKDLVAIKKSGKLFKVAEEVSAKKLARLKNSF